MPKVIVVGSIIMDLYLMVDRHPDAHETIIAKDFSKTPGGKGLNTAVAASKLGASTVFVGRVGEDAFGSEVKSFLSKYNILSSINMSRNETTGVAFIQMAPHHLSKISVFYGSNMYFAKKDVEQLQIGEGDVIIGQLEIPHKVTRRLFELGREAGAKIILNLSPMMEYDKSLLELADMVIMNESELSYFCAKKNGTPTYMMTNIREGGNQDIVVTMGEKGAMALEGTRLLEVQGRRVNAIDTTGAGDCFLAALAVRISKGDGLETAIDYANAAASVCVQRLGTGSAMPTEQEVENIMKEGKA